ncbi:MAG: fibronectin type III domain-containing protein [Lentisphaerae bacterium]|nr:fibronectin type III domain-containing protein [Lentisphaerota bacterium]
MSKYNKNLKNNYYNSGWSWLTNYGTNIVLLGNTYSSDTGGYVRNGQPYSSGSYHPDNSTDYAVTMSSGQMLTIGGNYSSPNIQWVGSWVQGPASAVIWSGDGLLNFTAHTGGDILGTAEADANSQVSDVGIRINVKNSMPNAYDFNGTNKATPAQNISAYGFNASGTLRLVTDMAASINAESGTNSANAMRGYYTVSGTTTTLHNLSSNNVVESSALKAASIVFDNHFTGNITVKSELDAMGYGSPDASSNTVTAAGVNASGNISLENGYWAGSIDARSEGNLIYGDFNFVLDSSNGRENSATVNGNKISALGITGDTVTIKDFNGEIFTSARDNHFVAAAVSKENQTCSVTSNVITSVGIKAATLNVTGDFSGSIQAENSNISQSYTGGKLTASGNAATAYGIEATTISVNGSLRGDIEVVTNNIRLLASDSNTVTIDAAGIKATTITVDGYIASDISMSCIGYIDGISAGNITAQAFTGRIDIEKSTGTSDGIYVTSGITNTNDGVFDMAGYISVSNGGIWGFSKAVNLRVSGEIYANKFAVVAGDIIGNSIRFTGQNDFMEVAAGAVIVGDIDLTDMENTMYVDSNARIEGIVSSSGGKLNLTFMLNDKAMDGVTAANNNSAIEASDATGSALSSTTSITINLNDVVLDNNQPKTYYLVNDNSSDWTNRQIAFVYQNQLVYAKVGDTVTGENGSFVVRSEYTHDKGFFVVVESIVENTDCVVPGNLAHEVSAADNSMTISWSAVEVTDPEFTPVKYELEYRIVDTNGTVGKSITVMLDADKTSFELTDILDGQKVEYRVRTHYNEYRSFSDWSNMQNAVMGSYDTPVASDKAKLEYANPENAATTSSSVIELSWSGFETPDGLDHYEIRYYVQDKPFASEAELQAKWDSLQYGKGERYYHKYTTAREIIVSGLNDSDYVYWQVRAIDVNGNATDWVGGDVFQVTLGDIKDPVMTAFNVNRTWDTTKNPDEAGFIVVNADWSAYDPAGGSGVRFYYVSYRMQLVDENGQPQVDAEGNAVYGEWSTEKKYSADTTSDVYKLVNGNYQWKIYSTDHSGRTSEVMYAQTDTDWVAPSVESAYSVKYDVKLKPEEAGFMTATVSWSGSDNENGVGIEYYQVRYRKKELNSEGEYEYGEWVATQFDNTVLKHDFALPNGEYDWEIVAIDFAGNTSTTHVMEVEGDVTGPTFNNTGYSFTLLWDDVDLQLVVNGSWHDAFDTQTGLAGYRLSYRNLEWDGDQWVVLNFDVNTTQTTLRIDNGEYDWKLEAVDFAGNVTALDKHSNWVGDVEGPVFTNPDYLFSNVRTDANGKKVVDFEWSVANDPRTQICTGFSHYELVIYEDLNKDGEFNADVDKLVLRQKVSGKYHTSVTVDSIDFNKNFNYSWCVEAYDIGGNKSTCSNSNFTIDFTAPVGSFEDDTNYNISVVWDTRLELNEDTNQYEQVDFISDITLRLDFDAAHEDDLSGVRYQIQICENDSFSGKTLKNYYTSTDATELIFDAGNGSNNGHENMGDLRGYEHIYWRVRAIDGSGNASDVWFLGNDGNPIKLRDYNRLDEDLSPSRLYDNTAPSFNMNSEVLFQWDMEGGLYVSWDGAHDAFGIDHYVLKLTRETAYPSDLPLIEWETMDPSYSNIAKLVKSSPKTYTITTDSGDNWFAVQNLPDGVYKLTTRAYDAAGNVSEAVNLEKSITIDTHGPTLDTASVKSEVAANDVLFTWDAALDLVGVSRYELTYKKLNDQTLAYEKVQTIVIDGKETEFWLRNLEAGEYSFTLQAFDTISQSSNMFGVSSNGSDVTASSLFTIIGSDAGNNFASAVAMVNNKVYSDAVSYTDTADCYSLVMAGAGAAVFTVSDVKTLGKSSGGVKLTFYNSSYKKLKTVTLSKGTKSYSYNYAAGKYFVVVSPAKGNSSVTYSISVDTSEYPAATLKDDAAYFKANTLVKTPMVNNAANTGATLSLSGWVGFGDGEDYYAVTADRSSSSSIKITGITSKTKVTLYDANKKKLKSVTLTADGTLYSGYLGDAYYIGIASGDKGKGKYNSNYAVSIDSTYVRADAVNTTAALASSNQLSGWVGIGDVSDLYKFTNASGEKLSFNVSGVTGKLKLTVYDNNMKKVKSVTVKKDGTYLDNLLVDGNFYVEVASSDKGKKQHGNYDITINADIFPVEAKANNSMAQAGNLADAATGGVVNAWDGAAALVDEWVGFGDKSDYFAFEMSQAGQVDFNLVLDDASLKVGKAVKVTLYNADGKKLKLDADFISKDELAIGKYFVAVESASEKKYSTGYKLDITIC